MRSGYKRTGGTTGVAAIATYTARSRWHWRRSDGGDSGDASGTSSPFQHAKQQVDAERAVRLRAWTCFGEVFEERGDLFVRNLKSWAGEKDKKLQ